MPGNKIRVTHGRRSAKANLETYPGIKPQSVRDNLDVTMGRKGKAPSKSRAKRKMFG